MRSQHSNTSRPLGHLHSSPSSIPTRYPPPPPCCFPEREGILKTVTGALEKYLEQPHLLDPHLEAIMEVVMGRAKELVVEREEEVLAGSGGGARGRPGEAFPFQVCRCIRA